MREQYYLYEYKRQSPYIDKEEYLILTNELINLTTKKKPIKLITYKNEFEELYKLIVIITLEEDEVLEEIIINLANNLNKKIKYKNKFYFPKDYQSKVGREVAAHRIDVNSNRISSYNRSLEKIERKDKRDNAQAKIAYHMLTDNINNTISQNKNKNKIANKKALEVAIKSELACNNENIINKYSKLVLKRIVVDKEEYFLAKIKAAIILINELSRNYNLSLIKDVEVISLEECGYKINLKQIAKRNIKDFEKELKDIEDFKGVNKNLTYTYLSFKELIELVKKLVSKNLI